MLCERVWPAEGATASWQSSFQTSHSCSVTHGAAACNVFKNKCCPSPHTRGKGHPAEYPSTVTEDFHCFSHTAAGRRDHACSSKERRSTPRLPDTIPCLISCTGSRRLENCVSMIDTLLARDSGIREGAAACPAPVFPAAISVLVSQQLAASLRHELLACHIHDLHPAALLVAFGASCQALRGTVLSCLMCGVQPVAAHHDPMAATWASSPFWAV